MSLRSRVLVAGVLGGVLLTTGCASFADQPPPESWRPQEQLTPQGGPEPSVPGEGSPGEQAPGAGEPSEIPPPDGCTDYNPVVIATCLDTVVAVAALPGDGNDPTALVGERRSGRILRVKRGTEPQVVATIPVDGSTDGGLTGLALSPTFAEDQLIFAYITTPTDNRVVRIAPGDVPKPVITGIPRGTTNNRGALAVDRQGGALLLATGDAGDQRAAGDLKSLAGKVLRFNPTGQPATGNPTPSSMVVASGLRAPGGLCTPVNGPGAWVTDRAANQDVLYKLEPGKPLGTAAWTWPDRPGVAGCAANAQGVVVVMSMAGNAQRLPLAPDGSFSGKPEVTLEKDAGFGLLGGLDAVNDQVAIAGTVNKDGGQPVSSDDRAIVIAVTGGGSGGGPD